MTDDDTLEIMNFRYDGKLQNNLLFPVHSTLGFWIPYSRDNKRLFKNKHSSNIFENKHAQNIETLFLRYNCWYQSITVYFKGIFEP